MKTNEQIRTLSATAFSVNTLEFIRRDTHSQWMGSLFFSVYTIEVHYGIKCLLWFQTPLQMSFPSNSALCKGMGAFSAFSWF